MQDSIGGRSKTLMLVALSSDISDDSETLATLKFAKRVARVRLDPGDQKEDQKHVEELEMELRHVEQKLGELQKLKESMLSHTKE